MNLDDELQRYLKALPDAVTDHVSAVLREQAEELSEAQRHALQSLEQAPEDTGDLEQSCTVTDGSHPLEVIVQAGGDLTTRDGYDYALGFEHGTAHQPARPFFYPTYRAKKDDMQEAISAAINEAVNE